MKKTISVITALIMLLTSFSVIAIKSSVKLPIVMYHHLSRNTSLLGSYVISVNQFEKDLIYLKNSGYTAITSKELFAFEKGKSKMPEKPCMITFDDGFESVFAYALPLLKKYNMKAIVFIESSLADTFTAVEDHDLTYSYLNWEYINSAIKSGYIEIGCHSDNMHKLYPRRGISQNPGESANEYEEALNADTDAFKKKLYENTNKKTELYAIPFGAYNEKTIEILKNQHFGAIFTCTEQVNQLTLSEELPLLGRHNRPSGISSENFYKKWEQ